jgi:DNA polymerase-3 subunit gamma/tau
MRHFPYVFACLHVFAEVLSCSIFGGEVLLAGYIVLARKWRPAQFDDIVGQTPIVRTLSNAIRLDRIHHAYLLTGSRGIGKTSIARIFSKVIRCENRTESLDAQGNPLLRSCDQCSACKEITSGTSMTVLEIDGASNNGVEAVREIREDVKIAPASGAKKIYIIDEVHMLSTAAFNALLKTLEEPPPHVIFIFATTEPHKIPATILGRCQRFDLRRVTVAQIQSRLAHVLKEEGISIEPGALALIARAGDGSMRDALSLLDQVISFAGNQITTQAVRDSIGLMESQTLASIAAGVFARKPLEAIAALDQAYQSGHDLRVMARGLIEFVHAAILAKAGAQTSEALVISPEEWETLKAQVAERSLEELELIFQVLHHGLDWIARSPQPKMVFDVLLIKCASAEVLVPVTGAATSPAIVAQTQTPSAAATHSPAPAARAPQAQPQAAARTGPAPNATRSPASVAPEALVQAAVAPAVTPPSDPAPAPQAAATSVHSASLSWEGFIEHVRIRRPLLATILEHGMAMRLPTEASATTEDADLLLIGFGSQHAYYREQIQARAYQEQLNTLSQEYFGRKIRVKTEQAQISETLAARREREKTEREKSIRDGALNHPVVMEARSLFGGDLGPIELRGEPRVDASS